MNNNTPDNYIVTSPEWESAWKIANETGNNLFLTGKAGTGKTTFLRQLKKESKKRIIVMAPTGIAAINARGVTIHSFFQLPFSPYVPGTHTGNQQQQHYRFGKEKLRIIRGADIMVIDEVSMVRADLLDAIDDALRRLRRSDKPFGGMQMLLIGDLEQLAPVVREEEWRMLSQYYASPYFFDSRALKATDYATIELKQVFRQDDMHFVELLNKIRSKNIDDEALSTLNSRCIPNFKPRKEDGYIRLTTHNSFAQATNDREMEALPTKPYTYTATVEGDFPELSYPTDGKLTLKMGAQVMFVKNDSSAAKLFYNGMIGEVCAINEKGFSVRPADRDGVIDVERETWQNCKYRINAETNEIEEKVEGTFSQFPVKAAWAITIHKSQGLTFSHAIIDAHASFTHGQTYVALSRCKTLQGMVLAAPITRSSLISDSTVDAYTREIRNGIPTESDVERMRRAYTTSLITRLFDFKPLGVALANITRVIDEHLYKAYPDLLQQYKVALETFKSDVETVAARFKMQYERMAAVTKETAGGCVGDELQGRITKGAVYFLEKTTTISDLLKKSELATNNKQTAKQAANAKELLAEALIMKTGMLEYARNEKFSVDGYLTHKAALLLGDNRQGAAAERKRTKTATAAKADIPEDATHPLLFETLKQWRHTKATEAGLPAYCILTTKALTGIACLLPTDIHTLMTIPQIGRVKAEKYGEEIVNMVWKYRETIFSKDQGL